ncbi:probable serine/threonine-protein kinase kinX [Trifolium pratense]|uniref:probable serine/threonine-protein kinase kinX n=1 Tax=Trifolium pratense TaxID=57577 RepID=UPI001E69145C|nr:probable serine/threonine-protein kinase kinX [Trifolium pratense]
METEKHHRTTSNNSSTSELFVCFTSRLSSSSMKLSSKSILSPSRSRDQPQISLSSSLSRRLKSNGSMKGGQASPMFPTGGKKRGCGFENPEPSSPKVTCIGQVRVKTKKQGKKMRSRSKRRGEASFRRGENNPDLTRQNSQSLYQNHQNLQQECLKHRNQRWVHLPLTICEALREFSCFFPCRSSCMSNEREKEEKGNSSLEGRGGGERERERSGGGHGREGSCGAAFARWLVAYDGKGREIEVMVEHHEEMEMEMDDEDVVDGREKSERSYSQRRHIFEDLDIDLVDEKIQNEEFQGEEEEEEEEVEEKGRVSICVPPKNALLLMRCRSDPVKMAALANRFWESPIHKDDQQQQEQHHNEVEELDESSGDEDDEQEQGYYKEQNIEMEQVEEEEEEEPQQLVEVVETMLQEDSICEIESKRDQEVDEETTKEEEETNEDGNDIDEDKDETFTCVLLDSSHADLEKQEIEETHQEKHEEKQESSELSCFSSSSSSSSTSPETFLASSEQENDEAQTESENAEKVSTEEEQEQEEKVTVAEKEQGPTQQGFDPEMGLVGSMEQENGSKKEERERETLPECLLLMMCEPKLSMEVSKETWVCSTDFIRWLPERPVGKVAGGEKKVTVESSSSSCTKPKVKVKTVQPLMQPPRSSCSFPVTGNGAGMSMATMIEQKLAGCSKSRNGYEPFVLKRCKSEPMRSATKLAPEACFWNNRKLEPHPPPASLGVGAQAGVGF